MGILSEKNGGKGFEHAGISYIVMADRRGSIRPSFLQPPEENRNPTVERLCQNVNTWLLKTNSTRIILVWK